MGLDAWVHCDCFERGRLKTPPPEEIWPNLEPDGGLTFETSNDELWWRFETWRREEACEHPQMKLVDHRLGNIGLIALIRDQLWERQSEFPVLFGKVIYNGCHAGDFLGVEWLGDLEAEVDRLGTFSIKKTRVTRWMQSWWPAFGKWRTWKLPSERNRIFLVEFQSQMKELIAAAKSVGKPICF